MFRFCALAVASTLLCGAAFAEATNLPDYDVAASCKGNANERICVDMQYRARGLLVDDWKEATQAVRDECAANDKWQDYYLLYTCVRSHHRD